MDREWAAKAGLTEGDEPVFAYRVIGIGTRHGEGVMEGRSGLIERNPVLSLIDRCLLRIPLKLHRHTPRISSRITRYSPQKSLHKHRLVVRRFREKLFLHTSLVANYAFEKSRSCQVAQASLQKCDRLRVQSYSLLKREITERHQAATVRAG
jgi:hypothetical protein